MNAQAGSGIVGGESWSLAMIVRDAEPDIAAVLGDAASFCDELVVVDTGSEDDTKAVAAACGARVLDFEWVDDFSAARNFSFEQCQGRWILWLDADDRIPPEAQAGFRDLRDELPNRPEVDAVRIPYRREFDANDPSLCTFTVDRERVVRRSAGLRWVGPVHEFIGVPSPALRWGTAWVDHRPRPEDRTHKVDRNLRILERAVAGGDRSARTLFYLGNELKDHRRWEDALAAYREYLVGEGATALVWERYWALISMAVCAGALGWQAEKLDHLYEAVRLDSSRAEAFARLGSHHYDRKEWARAVPFYAAAAALRKPPDGFIDDDSYATAWDYLSVCHSELGMYEEALAETYKALPTTRERKRLFANIEFYLDRLRAAGTDARRGDP